MPLDRIVTVTIHQPGQYVRGVYEQGPGTAHRVWADRQSTGSTDEELEGGTRIRATASWRIRYRKDIADTEIINLSLVADGYNWNIEEVSESDERRRYLTIEAVRGSRAS